MNISEQLKVPFDPKVIKWRIGATNAKRNNGKATTGIALAYLDARDIMKRFDQVCGDLWQVEYPFQGCCRIGLWVNGSEHKSSEWVWRSNGADVTDVEGIKGQYSDAFKRAAVLWGPGRYLYYLPNKWVDMDERGKFTPPKLPDWALPGTTPALSEYSPAEKIEFDKLIEEDDAFGMYVFKRTLEKESTWAALYNSFAEGKIGIYKNLTNDLLDKGNLMFKGYLDIYDPEQDFLQFEGEDMTPMEFDFIKNHVQK